MSGCIRDSVSEKRGFGRLGRREFIESEVGLISSLSVNPPARREEIDCPLFR